MFRTCEMREARKRQANGSIKWTYIRVCRVRREQMLKLKIYGARTVKNLWKRMWSWEQVVGIVSHLTECLPFFFFSSYPSFRCSTRQTSYREGLNWKFTRKFNVAFIGSCRATKQDEDLLTYNIILLQTLLSYALLILIHTLTHLGTREKKEKA